MEENKNEKEKATQQDNDVEVIGADGAPAGLRNAPAIRKIIKAMGFCKYCNQARMVEAPDGSAPDDLNNIASEECECNVARREREKRYRMDAAGEWAKNTFTQDQLPLALCAIRAAVNVDVDYVSIKIGKYTHRVDLNSDGMIRFRSTYRDSNEETF